MIYKFEVKQLIFQGKSYSGCMVNINDQVCDSLLEEDCEYNGELLDRIPEGQITDTNTCETWCQRKAPYCKYWIYHNREALCILKKDGRKKCNGWIGPKEPSFDRCQNRTISRHNLYFHSS